MRILLITCMMVVAASVQAQTIDTVFTTKNGKLETFYFTLVPKEASKGLLVVLGGFSYPQQTMQETDLPGKAWNAGYTVVLPFLYRADTTDRHNIFQSRLEQLIPEVIKKYHIPENKFIIGGQSWAGHQAMLYTERAYNPQYKNIVKPNAVFGVDPPLDLKRLYDGYVRAMEADTSRNKSAEALMITKLFKEQFGGTPSQKPLAYEQGSSFYRNAKDGGNAKYLSSVPVRLYADPDVSWFISERNTPVEWTNLADVTACIVQLKKLGNKNAEFINCLGKGYQNGKRHPHGFTMLDADEFILWADKILSSR
ncbi:MAG: hypothetical protein QM687_01760 [Ferruginibacter sp.]